MANFATSLITGESFFVVHATRVFAGCIDASQNSYNFSPQVATVFLAHYNSSTFNNKTHPKKPWHQSREYFAPPYKHETEPQRHRHSTCIQAALHTNSPTIQSPNAVMTLQPPTYPHSTRSRHPMARAHRQHHPIYHVSFTPVQSSTQTPS